MHVSRLPTDRYGLPLSTASDEAVERYVRGIDLVLSGNAGAEEELEGAIAADEGFALAHAALASVDARSRRFERARAGAERARQLAGGTTRRERRHVEVLTEPVLGSAALALEQSAEHLDDFPADGYVLSQWVTLRRGPGCRELFDAILERIVRLEPAYGDDWYYLGTRAFYLHEMNRFDDARRYAERSLEGYPRNGNAAHNLAHCYYETGDYGGGLHFIDGWIPELHPQAPHYSHLNWHRALFELVQGRYERALEIYRACIQPVVRRRYNGGIGPPVTDATSLFWRLHLYGFPTDPADWREVDAFAVEMADGPRMPFQDAHCALAFAATGNDAAMGRLLDSLRAQAAQGVAVVAEVALPLVEGIEAFGRDDYEVCISRIEPIVDDLIRIDGSQAQRMVFEETLLRAYMQTGRHAQAEAMLRGRLEHRHSGRDFYWLSDIAGSRGDAEAVVRERSSAQLLWTGADPAAPELAISRS